MDWDRPDRYFLRSNYDYLISAAKVDGCWWFSAHGPVVGWWGDYRDWIIGKRSTPPVQAGVKTHYQLGQPQPTNRKYLGTFGDVESAKMRCEDHWRECKDDDAA